MEMKGQSQKLLERENSKTWWLNVFIDASVCMCENSGVWLG